jgi:hypothetical protein
VKGREKEKKRKEKEKRLERKSSGILRGWCVTSTVVVFYHGADNQGS